MLTQSVQDFIRRIDQTESETAAVHLLESHLDQWGIERYALGEVAGFTGNPPIELTNYPAEWVDRYVNNLFYYFDPVAKKARETKKGFTWTQIQLPPDADRRAREVFYGGRDYGLTDGISVPVFSGRNYLAVASFTYRDLDVTQELISTLELTTIYFHSRILHLRDRRKPKDVQLTARETESLHWVAQGKSDWEIGEILTISKETVHRHVENAKRKYGVPTRQQAILEAVSSGKLRY
jgi:DNA-binding CsgD family transcriptional regulator